MAANHFSVTSEPRKTTSSINHCRIAILQLFVTWGKNTILFARSTTILFRISAVVAAQGYNSLQCRTQENCILPRQDRTNKFNRFQKYVSLIRNSFTTTLFSFHTVHESLQIILIDCRESSRQLPLFFNFHLYFNTIIRQKKKRNEYMNFH